MSEHTPIAPLPPAASVLYFALPTLVGASGIYTLLPALTESGMPLLWGYVIAMAGMFPLLLAAAAIGYGLERRPWTWSSLRARFRLHGLSRQDWAWTGALVVVYVGGGLLLSPVATRLASVLPLPMPKALPQAIDPRVPKALIPTHYLGVPLEGNWAMALLWGAVWVLNVVGEELWWRGYLLPRQERGAGPWAWLLHGALWTLFHLPFWWNLVPILPSALSLSFVVSRRRNTTPGLIAHGALNGLGYLSMLLGVLGLGG